MYFREGSSDSCHVFPPFSYMFVEVQLISALRGRFPQGKQYKPSPPLARLV